MKVGIIQSAYIPWRGYFDFIDSVDQFVFYDDVQYSKGSWRNRNKVKTAQGLRWLTVPVKYRYPALICETQVDYTSRWQDHHHNVLSENYRTAPFCDDASAILREGLRYRHPTISALNIRLIELVCRYLKIGTRFVVSNALDIKAGKTERLIAVLQKLGATAYLSGPSAKDYLDESMFRAAHIRLEYKTYDYPDYQQLWGDFDGAVTVLDLIANCGPEARRYLTSRSPNEVAVP
jgi:hypothetical protein